MKLVLDASVAVKFYLPEIYESEASTLLGGNHQFHGPELIIPEFSSVIWKKVRKGELIYQEGLEIIKAFLDLGLVTHSCRQTALSAFAGAESTGLTVYDWTYLALAISHSCKFVTADEKFYKAVRSTPFRKNILWIADV